MSQHPQFQALRHLIQSNPDQLQTLMQTLQATQPELYQVKIDWEPNRIFCFDLVNRATTTRIFGIIESS